MYKSFPSRAEAEEYIKNPPERKVSTKKAPKEPKLAEADGAVPADGPKSVKRKKKAEVAEGDQASSGAVGTDKDANDTPKKKEESSEDSGYGGRRQPFIQSEERIE